MSPLVDDLRTALGSISGCPLVEPGDPDINPPWVMVGWEGITATELRSVERASVTVGIQWMDDWRHGSEAGRDEVLAVLAAVRPLAVLVEGGGRPETDEDSGVVTWSCEVIGARTM